MKLFIARLIYLAILVQVMSMDISAKSGKYYDFSYGSGRIMHAWVPDNVKIFRAAIIHMHGGQSSGEGPSAIKDLHWQALCAKWDAVYIAPEYGYTDCVYEAIKDGSGGQLVASLDSLSKKLSHIEIKNLPWCVWGHSCGGYWVTNLVQGYPNRTIAYFPRSGTGDLSNNASCKNIPMFGNQASEGSDLDNANIKDFPKGRSKGLLWNLSIDPHGSHDCRDSRLLAIPFFDDALQQRLPSITANSIASADSVKLNLMDTTLSWYGNMTSPFTIGSASSYVSDKLTASWIPTKSLANKWQEYMKTGSVTDSTAPQAPYSLSDSLKNSKVILKWEAEADLESGVKFFVIYRDGKKIGQVENGHSDFGDASGSPNLKLEFEDPETYTSGKRTYQLTQINWSGLESPKSGELSIVDGKTSAGILNPKNSSAQKGEDKNSQKSKWYFRFGNYFNSLGKKQLP